MGGWMVRSSTDYTYSVLGVDGKYVTMNPSPQIPAHGTYF